MVLGLSQINGNGKSICQNLCFFPFFFLLLACRMSWNRVDAVSAPRRRRVGAVSEKRKKKKKGTPPDTGNWRVVPVPVSDTCRTRTRRQKWRVRAT